MNHAIAASGRMRFAGPPAVPCPGYTLTPAGFYPPLSSLFPAVGLGDDFGSDGVTYYLHPGLPQPVVPTPGSACEWTFPAGPPPEFYRRTDTALPDGIADFGSSVASNTVRLIIVGDGILTLHFGGSSYSSGIAATRAIVRLDGIVVFDKHPIESAYGPTEVVPLVLTGADALCIHIIDVEITATAVNYFGWGGALWEPDYDPDAPPDDQEQFAMRGSAAVA